jgi:molecular chaperone GrpE
MSDETEFPETEADENLDEMILRLETEIGEWKDHALRAAAEAENVRRRAEREMNDARAYAIQRFAKDLFGVADNLERALQAAPKDTVDPAVKNLTVGIELIHKALQTAFEANGVKVIDPRPGEKFDPNKHQAVMEQPSADVPAGGVIQVLQIGYELFGRVVRPAMVAVAAKGASAPAPSGEPNPYAKADGPGEGETVDTKA